MTPIKRRLLYIFRGTLLRLRISWHGTALTISVGYHIDRSRWDGIRCRRNTSHNGTPAPVINKVLDNLEADIDSAFLSFEHADTIPSPAQLRKAIRPQPENRKPSSIATLATAYINETAQLNQWAPRTVRLARQSLDSLIQALGGDITIDSIREPEIAHLMEYLTTRKPAVQRIGSTKENHATGLTNNTINRYMMFIRQFARWAAEKGLAEKDCPLSRKTRMLNVVPNPVVYLTMEELARFRAVPLSEPRQEVADCFVFCCFTGLRYSDARDLRWSQVEEDCITVVTQKTHDPLTIELNKFSRAILAARTRGADDQRVFAITNNSDYNKITKSIAREAGIDTPVKITTYQGATRKDTILPKWQLITSHTPRKTFVTNALSLRVSPMVVMQWTGHKNFKAMKPYIAILSTARRQSMASFDTLKDLEDP